MDVLDPWTVTVAVATVCVGIIVLQWFTFQKKLKATHLLMEQQQQSAPSPKVEPHSVKGPVVPSPVTVHGPVVPSHVANGPVVPSPVTHVANGPVVPSPVTHVAHGPVVPSPVVHGSAAATPTSKSTKGRVSEEPPPPVKLPPLPEFFDQTFTEYGEQKGTTVVDRHRTTHTGCRFVRRIVRNCLPKEMATPKSIAPFTDKFLFAFESTRIYYLHLPKGVLLNASEDFTEYSAPTSKNNKGGSDKGRKYPVVIFIHDKDETCFDGEFIEHPNKKPSQTWLDLSDEEGIILVFAQARGQWANHKSARREAGDPLKTLWLLQCQDANQLDQVYLENILDDLREICSQVDLNKIYLTGYVDGGNLATDVAIGCTVKSVVDSPYIPWLKYPLAAVCLYMGGITNYQMKKTLDIDKYKLPSAMEIMAKCTKGITKKDKEENKSHKPDVLIVTGEPEIFSCIHAMQCFYQLGYGVKVIKMDDRVQAYYPENTMEIWKFFQHSPHL